MSRVLLDGWPLVYEPASPAALQTWALLAWRPPEVELILALPGERPDWLPPIIQSIHHQTENKPWKRLAWEQRDLASLGSSLKANLVHMTSQSAPIFSRLACTNSPAYFPGRLRAHSLAERFQTAAGQAGLSATRAQLWPADLPGTMPGLVSCPPFVHSEFSAQAGPNDPQPLELPETFVLYHGPHDETSLRRLLSAWSWAAGPIGGYYPLLLLAQDAVARDLAWALIKEYQAAGSAQVLPELPIPNIPALYRRCTVLFHPAEISPWGDPLLQALAGGRPIAAANTPWANSRLGQAAYLAPLDDPRALGAALITLVVEEDVAQNLAQAAHQCASAWDSATIHTALSVLWNA